MKRLLNFSGTGICAIALCFTISFSVFASDIENSQVAETQVDVETVDELNGEMKSEALDQIEPATHITYYIENKRYLGTSKGGILERSYNVGPGTTLNLGNSFSIATSCSIVTEAIVKLLTIKFGFSVTGTTSVSSTASWTVPNTYNGKKVRSAYMDSRVVYDVWSYDVYFKSPKVKKMFLKRGTVKKAQQHAKIERTLIFTDGSRIVI